MTNQTETDTSRVYLGGRIFELIRTIKNYGRSSLMAFQFGMYRLMPNWYTKFYFRWTVKNNGRNTWGNIEKVWTDEDIIGSQNQYREEMLPVLVKEIPERVDRIVDLGCGIGNNSLFLKDFARSVMGVDFMAQRIQRASEINSFENVEYLQGDLKDLGFIDTDSVDVVHMNSVFLHLPVDTKIAAAREMKRILKPNGKMLLLELVSDEAAGIVDTAPHVHQPTQSWLVEQFAPLRIEILARIERGSRPRILKVF